jgi:PPOX class probable F420-dependent enzyme
VDEATARRLVGGARVARLGTVSADGSAHLVPCTFALVGGRFVTAVDWKPKAPKVAGDLVRIRNVRRRGTATALVDRYDDADWSALWWVRLSGPAHVAEPGSAEHGEAVAALAARYDQYAERPPEGPAIVVEVATWRSWSAAPMA